MRAVTTLLLATAALAAGAPLQQTSPLATQVAYGCAWARGLLQGYEIGFFKQASFVNSPQCLDVEWQSLFVNTFGGFNATVFNWLAKTTQIQTLLTGIQTNCQYDEALYQYLTFCYTSQQCLIPYMFQTLLTKIFQVTTVFNDVAQLIVEGIPAPSAKAADIEAYASRFGQDVGKILRYATNYDPTLNPPALF